MMNRVILLVVCMVVMASLGNGSKCDSRAFHGSYLDVNAVLADVDVNNDGKVTLTEDRNSVLLGDSSKDGKTSRAEFVNRLVHDFCYPKMLASYGFDMLDRNNDNFLTGDDVIASRFGASGELDRSVLAVGLRRLDVRVRELDRKYKTLFAMVQQRYDGPGSW
ncbi:hypothetical protein SNE40_012942 [Patella caerulea]|uniref:EF-hand domain-containing protein n=1 Tax=Patella caerulea TaxID=87958 RepID=A0AAN8JLB2_PATCE